jgi:hypothetical protein
MAKKKSSAPVKLERTIMENGNLLVYSYTADGYFLGTQEANPNPLEPGNFLIPASATDVSPTFAEGKLTRWNGSEWVLEDVPEPEEPAPAPELTDDQKAEQARANRNNLLQSSDWTQLGDVPRWVVSKLEDWQAYRQALRDVPQQAGFPSTINWPTAP